jgi:hypothetical protein
MKHLFIDILYWFLSGIYLILLIIGIISYYRFSYQFPWLNKTSWMLLLSFLILTFCRSWYFGLTPIVKEWPETFCQLDSILFFLNISPGFFMFAIFLLLLVFWAQIYSNFYDIRKYGSPLLNSEKIEIYSSKQFRKLNIFLFIIFIIILLLIIILFTLYFFQEKLNCKPKNSIIVNMIIFSSSITYTLSLPITIIFLIYGYRIYKKQYLKINKNKSIIQRKILFQVFFFYKLIFFLKNNRYHLFL